MQKILRIFDKFHNPPKSLSGRHYRFYVFINYAFLVAGLFHFAFIGIFAFFDLKVLSIYNFFSCVLWGVCLYLNISGFQIIHILLANLEVLIHAALCAAILGWESGFHYFVLSIPLVVFFSPWPMRNKIGLCILNCMAYALLYYFVSINPPERAIAPIYVRGFNYVNMTSIFFTISFLGYYYRRIVLHMEQKLEIAHQCTTDALMRLNDNLSDAAVYVKTILPEPIHEGPICSNWGFMPSESLGGDAFGYNWLDQENFAIYLLDVSGHGVSAALLSATIMNVLRSSTLPQVDLREPDQVLSALNRSFPSEDNNDMFFTIWYGVYNCRSRDLAYASGGHPPALLCANVSSGRTPLLQLGTRNNVIGGFKNTRYRKNVKTLIGPAQLYVFSDGVYEFAQSDGHRWNYDQFANYLYDLHLRSDGDLDGMVSSIKNLNPSDVFEDDFTILKICLN